MIGAFSVRAAALVVFCRDFHFKQNSSAFLGMQPYLKLTLTLELIIQCLLSDRCVSVCLCVLKHTWS